MTEEIIIAKIPSILTLSTRIILKHFGHLIFKLKSKGGLTPQEKTWLNEDLGISRYIGDSNRIEINYLSQLSAVAPINAPSEA